MEWIEIADVGDGRIAAFSTLKQSADRLAAQRLVVVEGIQAVEQLLKSPLAVRTVFAESKYHSQLEPLIRARGDETLTLLRAQRSLMSQLVGFRLHQGILALAVLPESVLLDALPLPVVAFCGLLDAENIGAIVRTAVALGVRSFLLDSESADPFLRRAVRVSMGSVFSAQICRVERLAEGLSCLKERSKIYCIETGSSSVDLNTVNFAQNAVFVFGNERSGISAEVLALACEVVEIGIDSSAINSLNVHAAAAIALHWRKLLEGHADLDARPNGFASRIIR